MPKWDKQVSLSDDVMSRAEVAALLGCTEWLVRKLTASGGLPCIRSGRSVRYHRAEVERWRERGREADARAPEAAALLALLEGGEVTLEVTIRVRKR